MNGEFVAAMEDVLDLYAEPCDPDRPVVCFDETSTQLLAGTRASNVTWRFEVILTIMISTYRHAGHRKAWRQQACRTAHESRPG